jgi:hypothetical protein
LAAVLAIAVLGARAASGSITAGKGQFRPTCRSGSTLFRHRAVRVFSVSSYDVVDKGKHQRILICLRHSPKPAALYDPGPFNGIRAHDFHIRGGRLGFVVDDEGISNGSETDVGWVDLRTGQVRFGVLNAGVNAGPSDPLLPVGSIGYAFAPDGTTAVISGSACQVLAVLPVRAKPLEQTYRLGPASVIFTATKGGLDQNTIAITATTVTWRTDDGRSGSAARSGGSTGTRSQTGGC